MGQIDSFKRVLGIAGQESPIPETGIEVKEEVVKQVEPKPSVPTPKEKPIKRRATIPSGGKSTLAVSTGTREEMHLLSFWARRQGLTQGESSEDLLRFLITRFYKKYPDSKAFVEQMRLK